MSAQGTKSCLVCGQAFEKQPGVEFDMCPSCMKKMGDKYAAQPGQEAAAAPARKNAAVLWAVLGASIALNVFQVPRLKKAVSMLFPEPPADLSKASDPQAQCAAALWHASALIQKNQWTAGAVSCPATKNPYRTSTSDKGDLTVSCPNPKEHGMASMSVSRNVPAPHLVVQGQTDQH